MNAPLYDVLIQGGEVFSGSDQPAVIADVAISDGRVVRISEEPIPAHTSREVYNAKGRWVVPGFIDFHTHYDAEVEVAPALAESVRHGVTTIVMGSCSLSAALGEPEDIADIFCRVEAIPRQFMLPILQERKDWHTLTEYFEHFDRAPLGPNVAAFVGHSNVRMQAMGFHRSLDPDATPTPEEMQAMADLLKEGLDAGYLGLSIQTLAWDKLDGNRERSKPLPSYFAKWSEHHALTDLLRKRGRVFQGVPDIVNKVNVLRFLWESVGLWRRPLKTTVISIMDLIANRNIYWAVLLLPRIFNKLLGADFRFQALPNVFDVWADGMDLVIFEEFQAGTEAMHLVDLGQRAELLREPGYRKRFRKEWSRMFSPRVYHRDFAHSQVMACPEEKWVGRSFAEIAQEQQVHPVEAFLDLAAEHGPALRWHSVIANDRTKPLEHIVAHPDSLIGFSDAGAHLRNMAFYNFPIRMLALCQAAKHRNEPIMSAHRAVYRLTGEIADWFGIDAGHIAPGKRADIAILDPVKIHEENFTTTESEFPGFPGFYRLVNRNPGAVPAVFINGKLACEDGQAVPELGNQTGFGQVLRAEDR